MSAVFGTYPFGWLPRLWRIELEEKGMAETFAVQGDVRGPWRKFIDEIVPLRPDLFRFCCGLTGNIWDGEDLAQDTLLRVFGLMGKVNADLENPRAYLIRAATHLWIDRIRRAGVAQRYAAETAPLEDTADDPDAALMVRRAAIRLFVHLAPQERAAVLLKDVLDFSLEETAAMLKTTTGAVKAALHRGRNRLKAAQEAPAAGATVPRAVVDRFVTAMTAKNFDAIRALCLADVTVDMVGGNVMESYEQGKIAIEFAHFVIPGMGMGTDPRWETAAFEGEPIAIGYRTKYGVEGINEVWRFEMGDGGVAKVRLYCFTPDVLEAVAQAFGVPALQRPYRSPPYD
jgi:RNA polymerase sigma-70 factor (ECF subfamily)